MIFRLASILVVVMFAAACTSNPTSAPTETTAETTQPDVPSSIRDVAELCRTQTGFPGMASYTPGPGPHPIMVFEQVRNSENNTYSLSAKDLPESWLVDFDRASDDSTPLHAIELVACVDVKQTTDSGRDCQFEDDEGTVTDFDIIHGLFDLAVYEAATGNLVRTMPIRSSPLQCPQFIYTFDDETEYFEGPSAEDYETMLAPTLDPG